MNFAKVKLASGCIAGVSLIWALISLFALRESLPDNYGPITLETTGGLGAVVHSLFVVFIVSVFVWIMLLMNDVDQPDLIDRKTKAVIVLLATGLSFVVGLAFYTRYYFILAFALPVTSGICLDFYNHKRYPAGLIRMYNQLCTVFGMMGGYVLATALAWDGLHTMDEWDPSVMMGLLDTSSRAFSLLRIGIFMVIYMLLGVGGMFVAEHRRSYSQFVSRHGDREALVARNLRNLGLATTIIVVPILLMYIFDVSAALCCVFGGLVSLLPLVYMLESILNLIALFE